MKDDERNIIFDIPEQLGKLMLEILIEFIIDSIIQTCIFQNLHFLTDFEEEFKYFIHIIISKYTNLEHKLGDLESNSLNEMTLFKVPPGNIREEIDVELVNKFLEFKVVREVLLLYIRVIQIALSDVVSVEWI